MSLRDLAADWRATGGMVLLAAVGLVLFALVPLPELGIVVVLLLTLVSVVYLSQKWPVTTLWVVLVVYYFMPFSSINPLIRAGGEYFTIYKRIFGPLSVWDVLLGLAFILILISRLRHGQLTFPGLPSGTWLAILGIYLFAFLMGLLHTHGNLLSYGRTELLRPLVAAQPILYKFALYWITATVLQTPLDIRKTIQFVKWLSLSLILYGIIRAVLIFSGVIITMWPFGLPIVLYDQMMMLYLPIFWGLLAFLASEKVVTIKPVWAVLAIVFIISSARRFNYLLLGGGLLLVLILTWRFYPGQSGRQLFRKLRLPLLILVMAAAIVVVIMPTLIERVVYTTQTLDIYRATDPGTGSDIRRGEINNLFLNLQQRPYSYWCGFGLGTTWKAITYQPYDSFSFTRETLIRGLDWYPQFHLPYISLLFRYGVLGSCLYWLLCVFLLSRFYLNLKRLAQFQELPFAFYLGGLIFIILILPSIGDSVNPTAPILVGFLIGIIERTVALYSTG